MTFGPNTIMLIKGFMKQYSSWKAIWESCLYSYRDVAVLRPASLYVLPVKSRTVSLQSKYDTFDFRIDERYNTVNATK